MNKPEAKVLIAKGGPEVAKDEGPVYPKVMTTSIAIPKYALGIVVAAAIGFGILLGWELFGTPHLIGETYRTGNLAEWVAAIGTWVIGWGAWRYAREAHEQRLTEYMAVRTEQAARRAAKLTDMYLRTSGLGGTLTTVAEFHLRPVETRSQWHLGKVAEDAISEAKEPIFSEDDKSYLPATMMPSLRYFLATKVAFMEAAVMAREHVTGGMNDALEDAHGIFLEHLVSSGAELRGRLKTFDEALFAEMKR